MFKKFTLGNGVRIVCERIPFVRSVSVGVWVRTGSRNESIRNNGISHFVEHMLFKGTEKRNAAEIAESIDNIGGQLNAFTGKECTCFYIKTLDEHIDISMDVLSDMFLNSLYVKKDISIEKKVVLEEISMYEDSPEELVHDVLSETVWDGCTVGYPILGTRKSLRGINRETITQYLEKHYTPDNTLISVAGNFDEEELMKLLEKYFGNWFLKTDTAPTLQTVEFKSGINVREKRTEQVHICIGFEGVESGSEKMYPLLAINNILGGGMSSRLFQKIREKKGLVYSIYAYPTAYNDAGLFTIYAGMKPEHLEEVTHRIYDELRLLVKKGITSQELEKSIEQLKGNYILGLESTSSRMSSIGKSELMLGYINSQEEILKKISSITMESIHHVIDNVFNLKRKGISIVGNLKPGFDKSAFI